MDKLQADLDPSALLKSGRRAATGQETLLAWLGRATPFQNTSKASFFLHHPLLQHLSAGFLGLAKQTLTAQLVATGGNLPV